MDQYLDITMSTVFSGLVGLVAPFVFPFLFKLLSKVAKRPITDQEKRLSIVGVSLLISVAVVAYYFEWDGEFMERAWAFVLYLGVNFTTLRGVVQSVYELIIQSFPALKERLNKFEK